MAIVHAAADSGAAGPIKDRRIVAAVMMSALAVQPAQRLWAQHPRRFLPVAESPTTPTAQSSESSARAILSTLDDGRYSVRAKAVKSLEKRQDLPLLLPHLISMTKLGQTSLETRLTVLAIAQRSGFVVERPERHNVTDVLWAIDHLDTNKGNIRFAVCEVLEKNPLLFAFSERSTKARKSSGAANLLREMEKSVTTFRDTDPIQLLADIESIAEPEMQRMWDSKPGRDLLMSTAEATISFTVSSKQIHETLGGDVQQELLQGKFLSQLGGVMRRDLDAANSLPQFTAVLKPISRVGRVTSYNQQLVDLGIPVAIDGKHRSGFVVLREAAENDPQRRAAVDAWLAGITHYRNTLVREPKPTDDHPQAAPVPEESVDSLVGDRFDLEGTLLELFVDARVGLAPSQRKWLGDIGLSQESFVNSTEASLRSGDHVALATKEWQACIACEFLPRPDYEPSATTTKIIRNSVARLQRQGMRRADEWKREYLPNWFSYIRALEFARLPEHVIPNDLLDISLPPNHTNQSLNFLGLYLQLVAAGSEESKELSPSALPVVEIALQKFNAYDNSWITTHLNSAAELARTARERHAVVIPAEGSATLSTTFVDPELHQQLKTLRDGN